MPSAAVITVFESYDINKISLLRKYHRLPSLDCLKDANSGRHQDCASVLLQF